MNDSQILTAIRTVAAEASPAYRCRGHRQHPPGEPPQDYLRKAARFLQPLGYTLIRTSVHLHDSTHGEVVGPLDGRVNLRGTVLLKKGMTPALEYAVLCHELTHVILRHTPQNFKGYLRETETRTPWLQAGLRENPRHEIPCELAAAACELAAGLPGDDRHRCYISGRLRDYGVTVDEGMVWAAFLAAREITRIMQ